MKQWLYIGIACGLLTAVTTTELPSQEANESKKKGVDMQKIHQDLSAECFNKCWTLIEKPVRSADDVENMLLLTYASLWHWKQREDCQPLNLSIGYWQISRAHALAGQYEMAKLFGEKSLKVGEDNKLTPFHIGYAYEALARAEALHNNVKTARDHLVKARKQLHEVTDKEERELLETDLAGLEKAISNKPDAGDSR